MSSQLYAYEAISRAAEVPARAARDKINPYGSGGTLALEEIRQGGAACDITARGC